jgi:three-Cys-motif partner protein
MSEKELYHGREQTQVKHFILQKYLERFAHIIGFHWDSITYVDCFSGPWNVRSPQLRDSSFSIALEELRNARETHRLQGRALKLRCMFLEKDREAYLQLKAFAEKVADAEVETRNSELGGVINDILQFIRKGGKTFPFIFIDPTGWKGFEMNLIRPLLELQPCEVLINFMTDYVRRFIDHPDQATREQFAALFGSAEIKARIQGLNEKRDREDELFRAYAENVRKTGGFTHTCAAIILYPNIDRSFFHLIYATRNRKGVKVFKDTEKQAMTVMASSRAEAKQRKRVSRTGRRELFDDPPDSTPIETLRNHYLSRAKEKIRQTLQDQAGVSYERVWDLALEYPLIWESDLKEWVREWKVAGSLKIQGMKSGQRVPQVGQGITLMWQG